MQIFLPYPDHRWSMASLDTSRLNKQIVESFQLVRTCLGLSQGHPNHPARWMYDEHISAHVDYVREGYEILIQQRNYTRQLAHQKLQYTHQAWLASMNMVEDPELVGPLQGMDIGRDLMIPVGWEAQEGDEHRIEGMPWFVGHPAFHLSHQFNLARKRPDTYAEVFQMHLRAPIQFKKLGTDLHVPWGDPDLPLVEADQEPYFWPLRQPDGTTYFQVGVKQGKKTLTMTPQQALEYVQDHHPVYLERFYAQTKAYEQDPAPELARLHDLIPLLNQRQTTWPGTHLLAPESSPKPLKDYEESDAALVN